MLSRIVSSAVARVRMMKHCAGATPFGHVGATSGVVVAPSSTIEALAEAGMRPHSASAPVAANRERFMFRFNTPPPRQLRHCERRVRSDAGDRTLCAALAGPAGAQIFVTFTAFGPFGP